MSAVLANPPDPARLPSAVLAVAVHLVLVAVLFFGVRWSSSVPEAVVVELWPAQPVVEPVQERPEPPKVEPRPEPKVEPKPLPKVEAKPPPVIKKPDIVVEKEKPKPKPKPKPVPEPKLDLDFNKVMQEQLQRELGPAQERAKREPVKPAVTPVPPSGPVTDAAYAARISAAVKRNIVLPPDIPGNPEVIFEITLLPTYDVMSVRLRKSSGNKIVDDAVERAINKSSPLPRPDRPDQFQRQLELKFRPKD